MTGNTNNCYVNTEYASTYNVKMKGPELALRSFTGSPHGEDCTLIHSVVKFFNGGKGFGFINQNGGSPDSSVRRISVRGKALMEGDEVAENRFTDQL